MMTLEELTKGVLYHAHGEPRVGRDETIFLIHRELYTFFLDGLTNIANAIGPSHPDETAAVEWLRGKLLELAQQIPAPKREREHGNTDSELSAS